MRHYLQTLILLAAVGVVSAPVASAQGQGHPPGEGPPVDSPPRPEEPTPAEEQAPQDEQEREAHRRQILANLEAWKRLSAAEREELRQRILEFLGGRDSIGNPGDTTGPERDKSRGSGLRRLLKEQRQRLRERRAEMERRFREESDRGRQDRGRQDRGSRGMGHMHEGLEKLDPRSRKRYFYLRRILEELSPEARLELRQQDAEQRKQATRKLLISSGSQLFDVELARISPAAHERFAALDRQRARQIFREWLDSPSPHLRRFLAERQLLLPGDPPGRGRHFDRGDPRPDDGSGGRGRRRGRGRDRPRAHGSGSSHDGSGSDRAGSHDEGGKPGDPPAPPRGGRFHRGWQ